MCFWIYSGKRPGLSKSGSVGWRLIHAFNIFARTLHNWWHWGRVNDLHHSVFPGRIFFFFFFFLKGGLRWSKFFTLQSKSLMSPWEAETQREQKLNNHIINDHPKASVDKKKKKSTEGFFVLPRIGNGIHPSAVSRAQITAWPWRSGEEISVCEASLSVAAAVATSLAAGRAARSVKFQSDATNKPAPEDEMYADDHTRRTLFAY